MSISTIISLVINVLFALILGLGFLFGFKRGVKRAGLRIGLFLVFVIVGAVVSPYITEAILGIKITMPNGMRDTILKYFESLVRQNPDISSMLTLNPSLSVTLRQTIIVVCNFATFIVVALIMAFLSWIAFLILAKYVVRDKKKKQTIEEIKRNTTNTFDLAPRPEKKYRVWGSVVGVVHAFIFVLILFMPISGIFATAQEIVDTASTTSTTVVTTAANNDGSTQNKLPATIGDLIKESVPQDVLDIILAYRKTAIGAIASVGDLDKLCFDTISTINVRGQKISLRKELSNACSIYENIVYIVDYDFENSKFAELNFEKIDVFVDELFSSDFVMAISSDIVPYALEKFIIDNKDLNFGNYTSLVKGEGIYSEIGARKFVDFLKKTENPSSEIKNDFKETYEVLKLLMKEGIVDDIIGENVGASKILEKITAQKENGTILTQTINHLMKTNTLKIALNMGFNAGIKALDENLSSNIGTVKYDEKVWGVAETDVQNFATNLSSSFNYFNSLSKETKDVVAKFNFDKEMFDALKTIDLNKLILPVACALDDINASAVFNQNPDGKEAENKPIIDRIIESIYSSDMFAGMKSFVKLTVANNADFKFENEFSGLVGAIDELIKKDVMSMAFDKDVNLKNLVAKFDISKENSVAFDDTFGKVIKSKLLSPSVVTFFNMINQSVHDMLCQDDITLSEPKFLEDFDINAQYDDIKTFWNNLIPIAEKLLNEKVDIENFDDNDYEKLATLMTGMKENVFNEDGNKKENAVFESIYTNIVEYLKQYETEATETTESKNYGVYFTGYYESYENKYKVDWSELLTAVRIAVKLNSESEKTISADDLKIIVEIAGKSNEIQNEVKGAVKDLISDDELKGNVDKLDLTDETTINTIANIADLAQNLSTTEEANKTEYITQFIGELNEEIGNGTDDEEKTKKQESVDTIVGIVDALADTEIKDGISDISDSDKDSIKNAIENAGNLSDKTKNKLKGLFGIDTSAADPTSEPSDPTPEPEPTPTPSE